ncbi:hypothetical protein [Streptomyces sp. NPDC050704]|uniref:hypothetical protein n=1 Tax=Streptomyces sp. NPDC050704 TaxID=3157219 RepID=UPI00341C08C6
MTRLQILELPEGSGNDRASFALVVDEYQPLRYIQGPDYAPEPVDEFAGVAEQVGARAVLVFRESVEILPNAPSVVADDDATLQEQLAEARQWARHGYEIGQRHCSWSDHGVAPAWLTEGWPHHFDSCEHLRRAAEYDEALSRVRALSESPEVMNADQPNPEVWRHGYRIGVLAAKSATRPRDEKTSKP